MSASESLPTFAELALADPILKALDDVGYEMPSPIQAATIPPLLAGEDLLGQAQTGTGKTAAFALPLLSRLDLSKHDPQVLVLAPTRELAIQVAEAFQKYARHLPGFHVLPIYGGQSYDSQLRQLKRGVHVVVGTPGRVMDHLRRKTLKLDGLQALVLDEADEMLRMGFIEDVEWILEQTPSERQVALFSATMPSVIQRVAERHLNQPKVVKIKVATSTASTINQRYMLVNASHKVEALTRLLEVEPFEAIIIFVRTKLATVDLAERLEARGYASAALNGDIQQTQRERTIAQIKSGKIDILVATDVAARGLDVERISHVINYDVSTDTEAYVHRVGRTGRAGRSGEAILFITPRERRMLQAIEKATRQTIPQMELPSTEAINNVRVNRFLKKITDTLATVELDEFNELLERYQCEHAIEPLQIAAALAHIAQGDTPLMVEDAPMPKAGKYDASESRGREYKGKESRGREFKGKEGRRPDARPQQSSEAGMERYRVAVGREHGVKPGNLVGAIANEAGLESRAIGSIQIYDTYSTVDLPDKMSREALDHLRQVWVCQRKLNISRLGEHTPAVDHQGGEKRPAKARPGKGVEATSKEKRPYKAKGDKGVEGNREGKWSNRETPDQTIDGNRAPAYKAAVDPVEEGNFEPAYKAIAIKSVEGNIKPASKAKQPKAVAASSEPTYKARPGNPAAVKVNIKDKTKVKVRKAKTKDIGKRRTPSGEG